jgi:hypothetical protein
VEPAKLFAAMALAAAGPSVKAAGGRLLNEREAAQVGNQLRI